MIMYLLLFFSLFCKLCHIRGKVFNKNIDTTVDFRVQWRQVSVFDRFNFHFEEQIITIPPKIARQPLENFHPLTLPK